MLNSIGWQVGTLQASIQVQVMHTGLVKVDRALPFKELDTVPAVNVRGEAYQIWLPMSSYLIEHPAGRIVVDAGWHEYVRTKPREHLGPAASFAEQELPEGWSIQEQLASRGLTPCDIDAVVVTHLDVDHISGLTLLQGAKAFYASAPELDSVKPHKKIWYEGLPISTMEYEPIPYGPLGLGKDFFGDGLVYFVHTPGHTQGQMSVLVRLQSGWLLLASDTGYAERSWREMIPPGVMTDEAQAIRSLEWVRAFSERNDCVAVLANHDPSVVPSLFR